MDVSLEIKSSCLTRAVNSVASAFAQILAD